MPKPVETFWPTFHIVIVMLFIFLLAFLVTFCLIVVRLFIIPVLSFAIIFLVFVIFRMIFFMSTLSNVYSIRSFSGDGE